MQKYVEICVQMEVSVRRVQVMVFVKMVFANAMKIITTMDRQNVP
tara:strand:+ start:179 stop:313 length:135 start_codon:yes stop_codon:yes gene_type:complete